MVCLWFAIHIEKEGLLGQNIQSLSAKKNWEIALLSAAQRNLFCSTFFFLFFLSSFSSFSFLPYFS